jgi:hypothetical protein
MRPTICLVSLGNNLNNLHGPLIVCGCDGAPLECVDAEDFLSLASPSDLTLSDVEGPGPDWERDAGSEAGFCGYRLDLRSSSLGSVMNNL